METPVPANRSGFFGKMPGYGDFIERNLPRSFIDNWDPWLQQAIAGSRQALGEHWLDTYLTMPIWRFALSSGCTDASAWLGVLLPSVDRVGRYFPLTLALPLPPQTLLCAALLDNELWFQRLEQIALACLNESPTVEAVMDVLAGMSAPVLAGWQSRSPSVPVVGTSVTFAAAESATAGDMSQRHSHLLAESLMRQHHASFSLWRSSADGTATLLSSENLPDPRGFAALMSGQWNIYGWNQIRWNDTC